MSKRVSIVMSTLVCAALLMFVSGMVHGAGRLLWTMEDAEQIAAFDDDHAGALFEQSRDVALYGLHSVKITPGGTADETKLAIQLTGENLSGASQLVLHVYLPAENELTPEMFFLGMADVTTGWDWVDGIFGTTEGNDGWNMVHYNLSPGMSKVNPAGEYVLYFAFAGYEKGTTNKVALTEPFYVDAIWIGNEGDSPGLLPAGTALWNMQTEHEVDTFGNDHTGAEFTLTDEVGGRTGMSVQVMPSGAAVETKLELDLVGDKLVAWPEGREMVLRVYLPPDNGLNPEMFFLGMADVADGWDWVGGDFAEAELVPGWNAVRYPLAETMRKVNTLGAYKLYLAFAGFDDAGDKIPLTEPFFIDGIWVDAGVRPPTLEELLAAVPDDVVAQVAAIRGLNDGELLDTIARRAFDYLWLEANPQTGLVRDRNTADSPASIAAVGFALSAIPIGIERGWITADEGYARALTTLQTFTRGGVDGHRGFFYHFVNMDTGKRAWESELSSVDTALFIAGALTVGQYFADTEVASLAKGLYEAVDWAWMMNGEPTLSMGWKPESGFLASHWTHFDEGLIMYVLAIASPTYPIAVEAWDAFKRPVADGAITAPGEVMFIYQFPLAWLDLRNKEDEYANYWNNAIMGATRNRLFTVLRRSEFATYDLQVWGLSASDGPAGYKAYGAEEGRHDGTIAPYASIASIPFTRDASIRSIRGMLQKYGPLVWDEYGFVSAFNSEAGWYSDQFIGIDLGITLLMIENSRSELVWRLFMKNALVNDALDKVGFKTQQATYAATPQYAAAYIGTEFVEKIATAIRARSINVDGDHSDWADANWHVVDEEMNVPADGIDPVNLRLMSLNSRFALAWDETALYVAVDVTDDVVVSNIAPDDLEGFYRTDAVELYFDPSRGGSGKGLMKLAIIPFDTEGNVQVIRHEDADPGPAAVTAPGLLATSQRTDKGYALELAVPWVLLGVTPEEGMELGFSQLMHNSNQADAPVGAYVRTNIISWTPVADVWAKPAAWGTLVLE